VSAGLYSPLGLTFDAAGNLYFFDEFCIRRIAPDGTISTVAGSQTAASPAQDGMPAASGYIRGVAALTANSGGDLFLAIGQVIRRIDAKTGIITTIAGNASGLPPSQGPALSASVGVPVSLYADLSGTLWISSSQLQTLSNGVVTTVLGPLPISPDGTLATAAAFLQPRSIAISASGGLYIGEGSNCSIRKVGPDGRLSTLPGPGSCSAAPAIVPGSIVVDSRGTVYASNGANTGSSKVYAISPTGSVTVVPGLLGGTLAIDSQDRIYEADSGPRILRRLPDGTVETVVSSTNLNAVRVAIGVDASDNLYVAGSNPPVLLPSSVYIVGSNGQLTQIPGAYPYDANVIAVDHRGAFWFSDFLSSLSASGPGLAYQAYGNPGVFDGPLLAIDFGNITNIQTGPDGSIYALDLACKCVRKITGAPPPAVPVISAVGVVNAASLTAGPVAPGELVSIFGSNLGPSDVQSFTLTNNVIPRVLDDIAVLVNGAPVPITAVSTSQINAFIPYSAAGHESITLQVNAHGAVSPVLTIPVAASAFGLFTAGGSGAGQGAILNQDGSHNSASNPASAGSVIAVFGTGEGGLQPATASGALVITTPFPSITAPVTATVGGQPAAVLYAGAAPFQPSGIDQINILIPAGTPPGPASIVIAIGGAASPQKTTVAVK
jgi:uncharacterized protein (TIGR03437 family)